MKVLFVIKDYYPFGGACANIIHTIIGEFFQRKDEVHILTIESNIQESRIEQFDGALIHRVTDLLPKSTNQIRKAFKKSPLMALKELIIKLFYHSTLFINRGSWKEKYYEKSLYNGLVNLMSEEFDVVIAVSGFMETVSAVLKYIKNFGKQFKFVFYQLDPISTNMAYEERTQGSRKKFEVEVHNVADLIITNPTTAGEIDMSNKSIADKLKILEFPSLYNIEGSYENIERSGVLIKEVNDINCVFAGYLYQKIRDPKYTLELFKIIKDKRIKLHILGESSKTIESLINEYRNGGLQGRLICYGQKSQHECLTALLEADILINIGNSVTNQIPSKLFTYMNVGKPIINIYKNSNCSTLKYLGKYPLALNLFEDDDALPQQAAELEKFILKNHKKTIPYEELYKLYNECTSEYVCREFYKSVHGILSEGCRANNTLSSIC